MARLFQRAAGLYLHEMTFPVSMYAGSVVASTTMIASADQEDLPLLPLGMMAGAAAGGIGYFAAPVLLPSLIIGGAVRFSTHVIPKK
jgi:hypothetical protein